MIGAEYKSYLFKRLQREKTSKKAIITLKDEPLLKEEPGNKETFTCAQCEQVFVQKAELRKHTKLHHSNPRYS